jgi:Peptidase family M48
VASSDRAFQRLELAFGVLGLTAALLVLVVAIDALQFHAASIWQSVHHPSGHDPRLHAAALAMLAMVDGVAIMRAVASLLRQVLAHRAFLRALPISSVLEIDGYPVHVYPGRQPWAFCAGLLRPAVYLSEGTLREVEGLELRAILAHQHHHLARHDPLRMLLARVLSDAFRPVPSLATLAERHMSLADLAADAAAVRAVGDVQPLAAALMRFDAAAPAGWGGVAPERVAHLARREPPDSVSPWLLVTAGLTLAAIAAVVIPMLLLGWHPYPTVPATFELAAIVAASIPAYLAARRAATCLRPAG